ncbi:hypothetical protein OG800_48350 [Streptomyces sp. NBC_00445]|uniref:hypothetical protein n=1 Tax=Streptomyces sp. NBC_00445 TaxID=2975745 RepID=UPI002E210C83
MRRAEESGELRPPLIASVHRIPGSESEAQEAVREAWLCWAASPAYPPSPRACPAAVVTLHAAGRAGGTVGGAAGLVGQGVEGRGWGLGVPDARSRGRQGRPM